MPHVGSGPYRITWVPLYMIKLAPKKSTEGRRRSLIGRRIEMAKLLAQGWTLQAIGDEFGVSRQRVAQLVGPTKNRARRAATNWLEPPTGHVCEDCGERTDLTRHHDDYSMPLEVRWLCWPCHRRADKGKSPQPERLLEAARNLRDDAARMLAAADDLERAAEATT